MDISDFKYLLWDNARRINDAVNDNLNSCAARYGLSGMQLRILLAVEQNGSQTVGSLANQVLIAGANISSMCKRLESMEMLTRVRGHEDERVVKIDLTPKSKKIMEEVNHYYEKNFERAMGHDMSENLEEVIAAMEKVNELIARMNKEEE